MKYVTIVLLAFVVKALSAQNFSENEIARWEKQASRVEIIRDNLGIPHVYGKTDADAVFGMLYAQCEDDFNRIEHNYFNMLGRSAEVYGEERIWHDLRMRLYYDTVAIKKLYHNAPDDLKKLMQAFANGVNYYLHTHPDVTPLLLDRFEPWWPLLFSEGSIGGDIETISLKGLQAFYGPDAEGIGMVQETHDEREPGGSNGFAIAPSRSASGHALLLINPHTSFYFRSEMQVKSRRGLNVYGAVTWGQFFIYQGFSKWCGWMHTSTAADVIDEYLETIVDKAGKQHYVFGEKTVAIKERDISILYKDGQLQGRRPFTLKYTRHGPVVRSEDDKWVTVKLMVNPVDALMQSYYRTKSRSLKDFQANLAWRTNSSNNTVFADRHGNIAYWHGNFMPRRNPGLNWSKPVDGSDPLTEWMGLHEVDETVQSINPSTGWIQNCNATPFTVAGEASPLKKDYPTYMAPDAENARGINAVRLLEKEDNFTLSKLIAAAYDPYLAGFERLIPALVEAYDYHASLNTSLKPLLDEPINILRKWNMKTSRGSVATTLASFFGLILRRELATQLRGMNRLERIHFMTVKTSSADKIKYFLRTLAKLKEDFGHWRQPWGDVNRFQRLTGKIQGAFDDNKPSLPVGFASSYWGSLASFGARPFDGTKKIYGYSGNSFVAVVEFGKKVRARAIVTGGQSSNPASPHFSDQSEDYVNGKFREVWYYKKDVLNHQEKRYRLWNKKSRSSRK